MPHHSNCPTFQSNSLCCGTEQAHVRVVSHISRHVTRASRLGECPKASAFVQAALPVEAAEEGDASSFASRALSESSLALVACTAALASSSRQRLDESATAGPCPAACSSSTLSACNRASSASACKGRQTDRQADRQTDAKERHGLRHSSSGSTAERRCVPGDTTHLLQRRQRALQLGPRPEQRGIGLQLGVQRALRLLGRRGLPRRLAGQHDRPAAAAQQLLALPRVRAGARRRGTGAAAERGPLARRVPRRRVRQPRRAAAGLLLAAEAAAAAALLLKLQVVQAPGAAALPLKLQVVQAPGAAAAATADAALGLSAGHRGLQAAAGQRWALAGRQRRALARRQRRPGRQLWRQ
eukprot:SAG22_NODE_1017_length_6016_cov_40.662667_1_plen_354_part_10